jgi:hypothetical protein
MNRSSGVGATACILLMTLPHPGGIRGVLATGLDQVHLAEAIHQGLPDRQQAPLLPLSRLPPHQKHHRRGPSSHLPLPRFDGTCNVRQTPDVTLGRFSTKQRRLPPAMPPMLVEVSSTLDALGSPTTQWLNSCRPYRRVLPISHLQ